MAEHYPFFKTRRFHFVGIGGSGMAPLAEILLRMGAEVSGSDVAESPRTRRLQDLGATVHRGHGRGNVVETDVCVRSSAIADDNPELVEAARQGLPIIHRGTLLGELMASRRGIAVAGAHGKTTTTGLLGHVLAASGLDPTVLAGGEVVDWQSNARWGKGPWLLAEADESDGSFLQLRPTMAIVTGIDLEHTDYYDTMDDILDAYDAFAQGIPFFGIAVVCADDPHLRSLVTSVTNPVVTYGFDEQADVRVSNVQATPSGTAFHVLARGKILGRFEMRLVGRHNVANAAAVIAACLELGLEPPKIAQGIATFEGVRRRLEHVGVREGVTILDDYGHHPTEILATLGALRERATGRVHVVFQPHRYSRTQNLWDDFRKAFRDADELTLVDIYAASESPLPTITAEALANVTKARDGVRARYASSHEEAARILAENARPGDTVITLGAGDVAAIGQLLLQIPPPAPETTALEETNDA